MEEKPESKTSRFQDYFELRSLGDYLAMIKERWFLGMACALAVSSAVGYYMLNQPAVYQAEAVMIMDRGERIVDFPQVVDTGIDGAGGMWRIMLENHMNQLTSRTFREYVAGSFSEEEKRRILAVYMEEEYEGEIPSVVGALGGVNVRNVPGSFLLKIGVRHLDPEAAALIANRYVESYIRYSRERREAGNQDAIDFLTRQAEELRDRVEQAEVALQEYRQEHNLVSVEENQNLVVQRLNNINANLMEARNARMDLEARLRQALALREDSGSLRDVGDFVEAGDELVARLNNLRQEREVMSERYLERHPRMIENERAIQSIENLINENVERAIADMRNRLESAREREENLEKELRDAEAESLNLDRLRIEYTGLQRAAEGARQTHARILDRLNETEITSRLEDSNIRIVDRASPPGSPVFPDQRNIGIMLAFLGGFVFVGTPIGVGVLDRRFKRAIDVESYLGLKLIGEIPDARGIKQKERYRIVETALNDRIVEAFRGIVSQLRIQWGENPPKSIMATSTSPGEGKSFLVTNLAYCFASHGTKTLLVDFDLRRPTLHAAYGLSNDLGILNWMESEDREAGDAMGNEALGIRNVAKNLYILRAGGHTKKATEVITNPEVSGLIARLKKEFDLLIVDTPPLGMFPDGVSLARVVEKALYVVRFGKVERRQVKGVTDKVNDIGVDLSGVVLNAMPQGKKYAHYYSGYGYCQSKYKYEKYYQAREK